jgi:D-glycero-D-manno-heptose 1,7-bisphosphate phosphatase
MTDRPAPYLSALFLDRDGVVVEEVGYLRRVGDLRLLPGAAAAIRRLNQGGVPVVLVTNQSGVARGLLSEDRLREIHAALAGMLAAEGARLDGLYYCPHHPTAGAGDYTMDCDCRKPKPGMLLRAARELEFELRLSALIGDTGSDIAAARAAGCAAAILVLTGHGATQPAQPGDPGHPDHTAPGIAAAIDWLAGRGMIAS